MNECRLAAREKLANEALVLEEIVMPDGQEIQESDSEDESSVDRNQLFSPQKSHPLILF